MGRLLWLSHFAPYPATGHGALQRTHHLLVQAARHHEVDLVALVPPGTFPSGAAVADAERALSMLTASTRLFPLAEDPTRVRRALRTTRAALGGPSYWERLFADPAAVAYTRRLASTRQHDLVHLDTVYLAPFVGAVGDVPLVLNHHNIESHLLHRRAGHGSGVRRQFFARQAAATERIECELAARAGCNLVVSDLDGERLRALAPGARTATVPNGVDVDFFAPGPRAEARPGALVWAGGMDWYPNADAIEWFADALWPALAADDPSRSATIIGRHPPQAASALAAHDPRVRVLGFVDDVRPFIRQATAYVCPIRVGGGTRLKVLDALALGSPLVATAVAVEGLGLTPELHYLEANDVTAMVAQVRRLERDPQLAGRLAAAGRDAVVARYSWEVVGRQLLAAYAAVRTGGAGAPGHVPTSAEVPSTIRAR